MKHSLRSWLAVQPWGDFILPTVTVLLVLAAYVWLVPGYAPHFPGQGDSAISSEDDDFLPWPPSEFPPPVLNPIPLDQLQ